MSQPTIRIEHVDKRFGSVHAVNDLSFEVPSGSLLGLNPTEPARAAPSA